MEKKRISRLDDVRVAVLAACGAHREEVDRLLDALRAAGASPRVVAPHAGALRAWRDGDWDGEITVDVALADARPRDFDAIVVPGGALSLDRLRRDPAALNLLKAIAWDSKIVAATSHGPGLLVESGLARDRELSSCASLRTDLENAGAAWVDRDAVADRGVITGRGTGLEAFLDLLLEGLAAASSARTG